MARAAKPARTGRRASPPGKKRTTEIDRVIGAKLRLRRGELGITQTQLANAIGVTFQQVQKYEQGAIALLRAFAGVRDLNQRQRVNDLVRALAGKEPLQDSQGAH